MPLGEGSERMQLSSTEFHPSKSNGKPSSKFNNNQTGVSSQSNSSSYIGNSLRKSAKKKTNMAKNSTVLSASSSAFQFNKNKSKSNSAGYNFHDPNTKAYNWQIPVSQTPQIQQFFPNISALKPARGMFPIDEKQEFVPFKRDRTNSDQFDNTF